MSKQTAAEKFDLVPPWCVVSIDNLSGRWYILHARSNMRSSRDLEWGDGDWLGPHEARRIARLTRPLPSWEPATDCPLPVEGWCVDMGLPSRDWCVVDGGGTIVRSGFPTRRAAIVWAWTEAEAPEDKPITDGPGATDGLEARVSKVEGVLHRICPEADLQTDGKGRTLREIDRELEMVSALFWHLEKRVRRIDPLTAAQVPVPAKVNVRSDAASTVEAATEAAAVDEGWREMLVPVSFTHEDSLMWWMTPDRKAYTGHCLNPSTDWGTFDSTLRDFVVVTDSRKDDPVYLAVRSKIAPPPNLAEWYKPKEVPVTAGELAARMVLIKQAENAVPSTYRVGDDLAAWVRNLALCHDAALKLQDKLRNDAVAERDTANRLRSDLAAAQAATVAAEGRADTAKKRASDAEQKLADLRTQIEAIIDTGIVIKA